MSDEAVLVYVTTPNREAALAIGRHAVEQHLAACANILPAMTSIYRWNGEVQTDEECVLLLKTRRSLSEPLTQLVVALHSYECPSVLVLPIVGGNPAYLEWLDAQTQTP
jgi:periplasmic divalent cation tolerance protein